MHTFKRDPALFISLGATTIRLIAAFFIDLSIDQQSALNAIVAAVAGIAVASMVKDGMQAAILGGFQALIALAIGFGLAIDADGQAVIMSFVGTVIAMFVRTQVIAPEPAKL